MSDRAEKYYATEKIKHHRVGFGVSNDLLSIALPSARRPVRDKRAFHSSETAEAGEEEIPYGRGFRTFRRIVSKHPNAPYSPIQEAEVRKSTLLPKWRFLEFRMHLSRHRSEVKDHNTVYTTLERTGL